MVKNVNKETENDDDGVVKLYYTPGQVSEILELPVYVIRRWERSFDILKPKRKRSSAFRQYTESDLTILKNIKCLIMDEKYTIEGAKQKLKQFKSEKFLIYNT